MVLCTSGYPFNIIRFPIIHNIVRITIVSVFILVWYEIGSFWSIWTLSRAQYSVFLIGSDVWFQQLLRALR